MSTLEKAISIAALAHEGQKDKSGKTYMLHPLRVMQSVPEGDAQIVAVLHDVLEDTNLTVKNLVSEGFSPSIIAALEAISRNNEESYDAYIERCGKNRLASIVKIADLHDNANLSRFAHPSESDIKRSQKYLKAKEQLEKTIKEFSAPYGR